MLSKLGRKRISIVVGKRKVSEEQVAAMADEFNKLVVTDMVETIKAGGNAPQEGVHTPQDLKTFAAEHRGRQEELTRIKE